MQMLRPCELLSVTFADAALANGRDVRCEVEDSGAWPVLPSCGLDWQHRVTRSAVTPKP